MEECNYCGVNIDNGTNTCNKCKELFVEEDSNGFYKIGNMIMNKEGLKLFDEAMKKAYKDSLK